MTITTHPSKEMVRIWLLTWRCHSHLPPPSPQEVRRQLAWNLLKSERVA